MIDTTDKRIPSIGHDPHWETLLDSTSLSIKSPPGSPTRSAGQTYPSHQTHGHPTSAEEVEMLKRRYSNFKGGPTAFAELQKQQALLAWDSKGKRLGANLISTENNMTRY